jgi:hypothetical protein
MWRFKKVAAPASNDQQQLVAVKLWYVRWFARRGEYSSDIFECLEAFPLKEDAIAFADSLRAAFKLLRHTSRVEVEVSAK